MKLCAIAAVDHKLLIGNGPNLPWRVDEDLANFRSVTMGKAVIVGRRTVETLPKLKGRKVFVLTNGPFEHRQDEPFFTRDPAVILNTIRNGPEFREMSEVYVIGGARVFEEFLPLIERVYLSVIPGGFFYGNKFFPSILPGTWKMNDCAKVATAYGTPFVRLMLDKILDTGERDLREFVRNVAKSVEAV